MGELIGYDLYGELSASQLTFGQLHRVKLGVDVFRDYGDEALFFLYFANDLPNDDHALSFLRVKSVFEAVLENNY